MFFFCFSIVFQWSAVALWAWGKCRQLCIYLSNFRFVYFVILIALNLKLSKVFCLTLSLDDAFNFNIQFIAKYRYCCR